VLKLPAEAELPTARVGAHRRDPSLDATLDEAAVAALRTWYRQDYALLKYCDAVRAWNGWGTDASSEGRLRHEIRRVRALPAVLPTPRTWNRRRAAVR